MLKYVLIVSMLVEGDAAPTLKVDTNVYPSTAACESMANEWKGKKGQAFGSATIEKVTTQCQLIDLVGQQELLRGLQGF